MLCKRCVQCRGQWRDHGEYLLLFDQPVQCLLGAGAILLAALGYAIGVFLLVPLGDIVNRRVVIPAFMMVAATMLAASALAPTFSVLLVTLALVGASTVSGQLLAPLAADLADDDQRGRVLGTVASGMLLGVMIARAISGIVTDLIGWRALYLIVAGSMLVLSLVMYRALPTLAPRARVSYRALLASVLGAVILNLIIAMNHRPGRYAV